MAASFLLYKAKHGAVIMIANPAPAQMASGSGQSSLSGRSANWYPTDNLPAECGG